jgi:hypothetical protein
VAIRVENMKIPFTPRRIPRDFRVKSFPLQKFPECIHIRDVKDDPPPPRHAVSLFEVKDRRF